MMRDVLLRPDSGPDLRFRGSVLAEVSSYEDGRDQWSALRLWRTERGGYVVVRERWRRIKPEPRLNPELPIHEIDAMTAHACSSPAEVVAWLHGEKRASWLTKELLDAAGIDHAEEV